MLLMWRGLCTSLPEIPWAGHLQSGHELKAAVTMVCSPLHENQQGMYNWVTKEFINLSWIYFSGALHTVRTALKAIITKECVHQWKLFQRVCVQSGQELKAVVTRKFVHQWKFSGCYVQLRHHWKLQLPGNLFTSGNYFSGCVYKWDNNWKPWFL